MHASKIFILIVFLVNTVALGTSFFDKIFVDNLQLDGNTISSVDTNGNIILDPNGTGKLLLPDLGASLVLTTDASKYLTASSVTTTELALLSGKTGSLVTETGTQTLTNKTLTSPIISTISNTGTLTLPTSTDTLVGRATTDTLTNKTLTSPIMTTPTLGAATGTSLALGSTLGSSAIADFTSTTKGFVGPRMTQAQRDAISSPAAGLQVYNTDTNKLNYYNGTSWGEIGSVTAISTVTNYITDYDGSAIGSWTTYADAAGTSPVDGTGGSPNSTYAISTNASMRGSSNFLWTHSAANRQGEGFSYNFTIDPSDKGKVLQGFFEYLIASGTYADDDLQFWIYDVTNSTLIQPAPFKLKNSGLVEKFAFEFQTSSNSTSYRLIGHVATTTATAYTIRFDNWSIGPQAKLYGSPINDWVTTWTPTGAWSTNTTWTGKWRRLGDSLEVVAEATLSGANTQGLFTVTLPSGYNIDTTKINTSQRGVVGNGRIYDSSTDQSYDATVLYDSATTVRLSRGDTTAGSATDSSSNRPITFASSDTVMVHFIVPILGWSSSVVMSNDASTRVIGARFNNSSTSISGSNTKIVWTNTNRDDVAGYSSGTYTVKVPGWYNVSAALYITGTASTNSFTSLYIYRNGGAIKDALHNYKVATSTSILISIADSFYYNAGDTIEIYASSDITSPAIVNSTTSNVFTIMRESGPSQIAANESVSALYTGAPPTGTLTSAYNTTTFGTKRKDSHNAYSGGTYTVPVSGTYSIQAQARHDATYAAGNTAGIALFINGVQYETGLENAGGVEVSLWPLLSVHSVPLLAGDLVTIRSYDNGTSPVFVSNSNQNFFSIVRTGNY